MSINIQKASYGEMKAFLESKGYHLSTATFVQITPAPEETTEEVMFFQSISELCKMNQIEERNVWVDKNSDRWCDDGEEEMADHICIIFEEEVEGGDEE
jgi:hypothetical protein